MKRRSTAPHRPAKRFKRAVNHILDEKKLSNSQARKIEGNDKDLFAGYDSEEEKKEEIANVNEEELPKENADEKRVRLAKEMLLRLEEMRKEEEEAKSSSEDESANDEDEVEDKIAQILEEEALNERTGRSYKFLSIADKIKTMVFEPTTFFMKKKAHDQAITDMAMPDDSSFVCTVSKDLQITQWELPSLKKIKTFKGHRTNQTDGHKAKIFAITVSHDGLYAATGGADKLIKIWNLKEKKLVETFTSHRDVITGLSFRKKTYDLYSISKDRSVKIWNCSNLAYVDTLYGHQMSITGIDSFKKERCVTCSQDGSIRVWKIVDETQLVFEAGEPQETLAYITEEKWISGGSNGTLFLWNVNKKKPIFRLLEAHGKTGALKNWITAIAAIPYSDLVATGSCNGTIKLWKVYEKESKLENIQNISMDGWINSLKFTKDGKHLVVAISQEHKNGSWFTFKNVKNTLIVIPINT